MGIWLRPPIVLFVVGELYIFGPEALAADPLFVCLCGGVVPSLDAPYRDVRRFDAPAVGALGGLMAAQDLIGGVDRVVSELVLVALAPSGEDPNAFKCLDGTRLGNPREYGRPQARYGGLP
ncbi:hypothetical protein [Sorangium sp. So ce1000]|uniref:hypothetical protein n=1 Tax=Sorangium sp. So ce1000 TaxID=3133325 RepID=UPI003F5F4B89